MSPSATAALRATEPLADPRLGARIASLHWQTKLHTILQILAFMLITPIGIAIGIGVRQSFSANGTAALVSIGILDSTSAGILVSTASVRFLTPALFLLQAPRL